MFDILLRLLTSGDRSSKVYVLTDLDRHHREGDAAASTRAKAHKQRFRQSLTAEP